MKRKTLFCTFALISLLLTACTPKNTPGTEISSAPESNTVQNSNAKTDMISEEEAKKIALAHAQLTADQVTFIKSGMDRDNWQKNYDVEFYTKDLKEYDYKIDPYTGDVLDVDFDAEYYTQTANSPDNEGITADDAKQIALSQVPGATSQDIRRFESDYDNGKLHYEGKIYYEQKEYEFDIDGYNGAILE